METKVVCPKCSSDQLSFNKKGFNVKKAVGGLLIPGGVLWGLHGKDKIVCTCIACGNQFKAGEGKIVNITTVSSVQQSSISSKSTVEPQKDVKAQSKNVFIGLIVLGVFLSIGLLSDTCNKKTELTPAENLRIEQIADSLINTLNQKQDSTDTIK